MLMQCQMRQGLELLSGVSDGHAMYSAEYCIPLAGRAS